MKNHPEKTITDVVVQVLQKIVFWTTIMVIKLQRFVFMGSNCSFQSFSVLQGNWIQVAVFSAFANQWSRKNRISISGDDLYFAAHPLISLLLVYIGGMLLACSQGNEKKMTDWPIRILVGTFTIGIHADLLYLNSITREILWGEVTRGMLIIGFCYYKLKVRLPGFLQPVEKQRVAQAC